MVPNAMVATFVPAPVRATPAASFSKVKPIELATVAVTVNVPTAGSWALAHVGSSNRLATIVMTFRLFSHTGDSSSHECVGPCRF
jgi:hypothetical protein